LKLLVDGDIVAYTAAFHTQSKENTQEEAVRKMDSTIRWSLAKTNASEYQVYLTGKGNFRFQVAKSYKAQRTAPKPALLPFCREHLRWEWGAIVSDGEEADDLIAIEAARLGYENCIVASVDKDFLQLGVPVYNWRKDELVEVTKGDGLKFFYTQCLMGDSADNVVGIPGVGVKGAEKHLEGLTEERDLYEACLSLYLEKGLTAQDLTDNARLLWLRRKPNEMWEPPE